MAFLPTSRISRATPSRSDEICRCASLIEHRQVDAGDDLHAIGLEKRQAEVRRCAAEHVGENQHAVRTLKARDRARNRLARDRRIVVPADRHRDELRQVSDDRLGRVHQLVRELPVGNDNDANHLLGSRL